MMRNVKIQSNPSIYPSMHAIKSTSHKEHTDQYITHKRHQYPIDRLRISCKIAARKGKDHFQRAH